MNNAWLEGKEYCTVQFEPEPGSTYWNISVPKGCCVETTHVDISDTVWIHAETGEVYDFSQPVMTDMVLTKPVAESETVTEALATNAYITFLSIAVLFILLAGFVLVDATQRHQERGATVERKQTKISP